MYTLTKALPTTQNVKLIGKKEFAVSVLNLDDEDFIVYRVSNISSNLTCSDIVVYPSCQAKIAFLKADEVPRAILSKYADFTNIFFLRLVSELSEYTKINNHAIRLIVSK